MTAGMLAQVAAALHRAHGLFGEEPPLSGMPVTGRGVTDAVKLTRSARGRMSELSGRLSDRHADFAAQAGSRLEALVIADDHLRATVGDADTARRAGLSETGRVVAASSADVARMSPLTATPAGQRALLVALQDRLFQQRRVVAAYEVRAARMATLLRSLSYGGAVWPGVSGQSPLLGGGGSFGGPTSGTTSPRTPPAGLVLASHVTPDVGAKPGVLTVRSSPRECAAVLIDQARRRGYSPACIVAMLSTMLQESGGRPDAVSSNGLWRGLFQQDAGYPGRADPNLAITGFLNRLSAKGGRDAPDIWKTIFWLQQAPGAASAEAAYVDGRRAYLREIHSQLGRATAMYRDVTGG